MLTGDVNRLELDAELSAVQAPGVAASMLLLPDDSLSWPVRHWTIASADLGLNKSESRTPCHGIAIIVERRSGRCGPGKRSMGNIRRLFARGCGERHLGRILSGDRPGSKKFQILRRRIDRAEDCIQEFYK